MIDADSLFRLAHLLPPKSFSDSELCAQLEKTVSFVSGIRNASFACRSPIPDFPSVLREDQPKPYSESSELLRLSPACDGVYLCVPRMFKAAENADAHSERQDS